MSWIANLSNGETILESKPIAGQKSAWQKLLQRCRESEAKITGLRLKVGNITVNAMPVKMCDGYFQAYEALRTIIGGGFKLRQGIGSVVGEQVYIIWVDTEPNENNMYYMHQEVRPLSEVTVHTTVN